MTEDTIRRWLEQAAACFAQTEQPAKRGRPQKEKGDPAMEMEEKGIIRRRYRFFGRVQGVGFRYRAKYSAQNLGLTGWVENEVDGSVTLEAQGTREQLARLVPSILSGSSWIEIDDMQVKEIPPKAHEHGFSVQGW